VTTIERLVDELERSYAEAQERMADPAVYNDHRQAADVGRRLKELRLQRGLSQEELAFRSGLHRTYVSSTERGQRNVSLVNIERLARALDVELGDLFDQHR